MDHQYGMEYRTGRYKYISDLKDGKHHYEIDGVLPLVLPSKLFKGNTILTSYLQLIDSMFVNIMKTIEKIKYWKCLTKY